MARIPQWWTNKKWFVVQGSTTKSKTLTAARKRAKREAEKTGRSIVIYEDTHNGSRMVEKVEPSRKNPAHSISLRNFTGKVIRNPGGTVTITGIGKRGAKKNPTKKRAARRKR